MLRRQEQAQATPASALRMIDGGTEAVTGGGIVMGCSYDQNPIIINALKKQSPRNSRTEGRGMAGRSREEMFM
jgi:hypothetical protein